ncbi:hypothetical protein PENPOL_c017G01987 [Penicillium polonicum]|uniref:Uncharacterized protein n=1 Tax=Penicillium polonicum TaxID=60169 RepID=A0A1V6N9X5_PENPO|nr:hypothetical protein PENPOL_c017G01987 [Penicillium polonicum]
MKAQISLMSVVLLLTVRGLAIPITDDPRDKGLNSGPKKDWIYRLNCSTTANAFFCQHHGAYCSTYYVHGSAFCQRDCICILVATCNRPDCSPVEAAAEDSIDSGNSQTSSISTSTDVPVPTPLAI